MKCEKCGYDDKGTGDSSHICHPTLAQMQPGKIVVVRDEQAGKLDEMADLCEYWKRNRERGRTPNAIRAALVMLARELAASTGPANADVTGLAPAQEGKS